MKVAAKYRDNFNGMYCPEIKKVQNVEFIMCPAKVEKNIQICLTGKGSQTFLVTIVKIAWHWLLSALIPEFCSIGDITWDLLNQGICFIPEL